MYSNRFLFACIFGLIIILFLPLASFSQFKLTDAGRPLPSKESSWSNPYSKSSTTRVSLPFIDDFSSPSSQSFWNNRGAFFNNDFAFSPPSVGIVTLDALDMNGRLYELANSSSFAADTLVSGFIRLDSSFLPSRLPMLAEDSIYLSFFVQPGGGYGPIWENVGSSPSAKDSLVLQFYAKEDMSWNSVWSMAGESIDSIYARDSVFWVFVNIPILDSIYLNDSFRFRFLNFASLDNNPSFSYVGNCDNWHIDYIYLNKDRSYDDITRRDIAFVNPARSLLREYQSMPSRQFTPSDMADNLSIKISNLSDSALNSIYKYKIRNSNNDVVHNYDGGFENIYPFISTKEYQTSPNHASPPIEYSFDINNDAFTYFDIIHSVKPGVGQDNNSSNDSIRFRQVFENYYAYDDGTAENGFGLEPIRKSNLALGFNLANTDTLMAVDIYFNSTYQDANQKPFYICVWNSQQGKPKDSIFRSYMHYTPANEGLNQFKRYYLEESVILSEGLSFISLETKYNDYLNIGFDRNTDCSSMIFGNWANNWEENTLFKGSLMIRPYFGYKSVIGLEKLPTSVDKEIDLRVYPNPSQGIINLELSSELEGNNYIICIRNILGQEIYRDKFTPYINLSNSKPGVYILSLRDKSGNILKTQKLIINQ